jgi:peptide chain release factor 1
MLDERLRAKLEEMEARYAELDAKVSDAQVIANDPQYTDYLREHGSLAKSLSPYHEFLALERERAENAEALADPELKELAEEELARIDPRLETLAAEIADAFAPDRKDDTKDVMLEIRAGTGGDEAALFAGDLLRMYQHFAETRGWTVEEVSSHPGEMGGFKEVVVSIQGENVYRDLKHEGGGHRVQRVPETETQGRIHTSAATVAVLPEAEEYEVELKPEELEIKACRSTGPGGQSVNTTDSAVHVVHLPTGITVHMQDEKSQHKNKAKALRVLRSRLYEHYQSQLDAERSEARRVQTGSGDRSQRVRTYNFPQNRVTDHRLGQNYSLDRVMEGALENLVAALVAWGRDEEVRAS